MTRDFKRARKALLTRQERLDHIVLQASLTLWSASGGVRIGSWTDGQRSKRELSLLETHIGNLVDVVARGGANDALLARLRAEDARKNALVTELEALHRSASVASLDWKRLERELAARAADIKGLLDRHVPQTRQILRRLIVGRLTCEAFAKDGQRAYRFTGQGTTNRQRMW